MRKTFTKKLTLSRETVRLLERHELAAAAGGVPKLSKDNRCDTYPTSGNPPPNNCQSELLSECGSC